jgi:hypothetical protein
MQLETGFEGSGGHVQNFSAGIFLPLPWRLKYSQGFKTNKSNRQFWKKLTFDWLVGNSRCDLFEQRLQYVTLPR